METSSRIQDVKTMNLPYSDELNIGQLSCLFDNTSDSYKFFWFKAVLSNLLISQASAEKRSTFSYEELIDSMIADAFYMVSEYHLNLGPNDTLEKTVLLINKKSGLKSNEERKTILDYLKQCKDKDINKCKKILTNMVPYRLLAPFLPDFREKNGDWKGSPQTLTDRINQRDRLLYYYSAFDGMDTTITIQPDWVRYLVKNGDIVSGWLENCMIHYLQKRNPNVPGIADKLEPPHARNMGAVKKYWKAVTDVAPVYDIYANERVTADDISIDHFVPWSYVAHDELWNLSPTTKSVNSSKGNDLPEWDLYFPRLIRLEYQANRLIWTNDTVHSTFECCARKNLNDERVRYSLYRRDVSEQEFAARLQEIILPAYQSARNCGFQVWRLAGEPGRTR